MKALCNWLAAAVLVCFASCSESGRIKERPDDIIPTDIDPAVLQKISENFPEHQNIKLTFPSLFNPAAQKQIILSEESDVYIAFISEGASYSNSFGWYSYNVNDVPSSASALEKNLLFPTVSDRILKQGDMLKLRDTKFPAGTVIGFFLVIKGWENAQVNYDRETFYTNLEWNTDDQQQHILFKQKNLGTLILSFEDQLTTRTSDQDFNDILFMVTDNAAGQPVSKIEMENIVELD